MSKKKKEIAIIDPPKLGPKRVYIEYDEYATGGEPEDDGEWSCRSDTVKTVTFKRLHREKPANRFFYDSIELANDKMIDMDHLFLAVVRYSTGNTFGHTTGEHYIVGIAPTYEIAQMMLDEETKPSPKNSHGSQIRYKPWEGYFESLEDTEIHQLRLV